MDNKIHPALAARPEMNVIWGQRCIRANYLRLKKLFQAAQFVAVGWLHQEGVAGEPASCKWALVAKLLESCATPVAPKSTLPESADGEEMICSGLHHVVEADRSRSENTRDALPAAEITRENIEGERRWQVLEVLYREIHVFAGNQRQQGPEDLFTHERRVPRCIWKKAGSKGEFGGIILSNHECIGRNESFQPLIVLLVHDTGEIPI